MNAEEKQALIEHCKMNILQAKGILPTLEGISPESEVARKVRKELTLQEIALAALTAVPRGYIDAGTPSDEINILTENKILKTDIALYTAPPAPVLRVPDGWKLVPSALTAENGAKAALLGEFTIEYNLQCHECFGEGCDDCDGEGRWVKSIPVDWATIKAIWAKGVEHFQEVPTEASNEQ